MQRQPRHRLGVALEVGEPARAALRKAVEPYYEQYPGLRWMESEYWHVEVCLLGAVDAAAADRVDETVAEVAAEHAQVALRLDGGAGVHAGSAMFAGVCPSEPLMALRTVLLERCTAADLPIDRRSFLPHCILGRAPGGTRLPPGLVRGFRGPKVTWVARRLLVIRTRLRLGGVAHEIRSAPEFGQPVAALPEQ